MRIHALTVCVNYSDFLRYSAPRWINNLASWTIITDAQDEATVGLAKSIGAQLFRTNVFYERGAKFNKGAALEAARLALPWEDWFLFLDADIVPPADWYEKLLAAAPQPNSIHFAPRVQCDDIALIDTASRPILENHRGDGPGYFQLFHTSDSHFKPIEKFWPHAGVYDTHFAWNWPVELRRVLPLQLVHLGERENWFGRGNREDFNNMNRERRRLGGYQHERIS